MKLCTVPGCTRRLIARGWCHTHYKRWQTTGTTDLIPKPLKSFDELFWPKVEKDGPVPEFNPSLGPCWIWTGSRDSSGYGTFNFRDKTTSAHRISYEKAVGPIPEGLHTDHLCRVHECVNPEHLEPVTPLENWRRGFAPSRANALATHCKNGHPFDEKNTYYTGKRRFCRECNKGYSRRYAERKKARANA